MGRGPAEVVAEQTRDGLGDILRLAEAAEGGLVGERLDELGMLLEGAVSYAANCSMRKAFPAFKMRRARAGSFIVRAIARVPTSPE